MPTKRERYRELDKNDQPLPTKHKSHPTDTIKILCTEIPSREKQITQLFQLIGMPGERVPPSIFLHGVSSTGKTLVVSRLLGMLQCRYAIVNCECYQLKLLFEPILNSLTRHDVRSENNFESYARCDNTLDFVKNLKTAAEALDFTDETLLIVLENCEGLRTCRDANLVPCLLHLQELTRMNVCVVFASDVAFENFVPENTSLRTPITIHFPQYTQGEFVDVLLANFGASAGNYSQDFQRDYVTLLVRVYFRDCRNLNELQRLTRLHFAKYCEPIEDGTVAVDDPNRSNKLWRQLRPQLGSALENLQFSVNSARQLPTAYPASGAVASMTYTEQWALAYELPYYTKYLLVAAYLASYNPEKSDQRVFFKALGKQKKRKAPAKDKLRDHLLGPKYFATDRLFAIFYAVIDEKLSLTVNLQAQISSLVKLELLATKGDNYVESPKLKCTVPLDFVKAIARNLGFDVERYIYNLI